MMLYADVTYRNMINGRAPALRDEGLEFDTQSSSSVTDIKSYTGYNFRLNIRLLIKGNE